jgi:hypothetical protein
VSMVVSSGLVVSLRLRLRFRDGLVDIS